MSKYKELITKRNLIEGHYKTLSIGIGRMIANEIRCIIPDIHVNLGSSDRAYDGIDAIVISSESRAIGNYNAKNNISTIKLLPLDKVFAELGFNKDNVFTDIWMDDENDVELIRNKLKKVLN